MNRSLPSRETLACACCWFFLLVSAVEGQAPSQNTKVLGTVNSVNGNSVLVTSDDGKKTTVVLSDSTRLLRASPGQSELKSAAPASVAEIETGDRLLARGESRSEGTLAASLAILMKKSAIAERQSEEREEWRRGIGGIVKEVDRESKTVTITNAFEASGKPVVIHISEDTAIRRYSPDSVKFEDSKPGTLNEINPGDQLRARGTRKSDGTEFAAQALVSGTFRDIAGTVVSIDPSTHSLTVIDLAAKAPVTLTVSPDSELRKLPPPVAQVIAMRLKGAGAPGPATPPGGPGAENSRMQGALARQSAGPGAGAGSEGNRAGAEARSRRGDFQQMLNRLPAISIGDLEKGQAVMLVSTEGSAGSRPTAIKVLTGVEPILTAAPTPASASSILSPWNLGPAAGGADAAIQ